LGKATTTHAQIYEEVMIKSLLQSMNESQMKITHVFVAHPPTHSFLPSPFPHASMENNHTTLPKSLQLNYVMKRTPSH
jgi:hypothetical protein